MLVQCIIIAQIILCILLYSIDRSQKGYVLREQKRAVQTNKTRFIACTDFNKPSGSRQKKAIMKRERKRELEMYREKEKKK